jgi:hypothetical protein
VDVVGVRGGFLLVLMIQTPHSLHTHSRSSLYIYNAIQHLLLWLQVLGCCHTLIFTLCDLRVDLLDIGGGSQFVLIIEASNPLHTLSRSSLYIYTAIQHLLKRLQDVLLAMYVDTHTLK